ncbi:MAG: PAS domain-containing protein [Chloroflexota bacterium]|nr:MAG: PAS domain-containing protein [Chloroflexota bacterium]
MLALETEKQASLLSAIFQHSPDGMAFIDTDLVILAANKTFAEQIRVPLDQITGQPGDQIIAGWTERVGHIYREVRDTGEPFKFEAYPFIFQDQPERDTTYWDSSISPVCGANGTFLGWLLLQREVTERVRSERERERLLEEAEAQREMLQKMIENAPAGIAVLRGRDLIFEVVNASLQAIAPYREFVGKTVVETWPELSAEYKLLLQQVLDTGESYRAVDVPLRIRRHSQGHLEETFLTFSFVALPPAHGGEGSVLVLVVDTTEHVLARKQVEELAARAKRHTAQMSALLKSLKSAVVVVDASGQIVLRNEAVRTLSGVPDELASSIQSIHSYDHARLFWLDGRTIPFEQWPATRLLRGEEFVEEEYILERQDGSRCRVVSSGSVVLDEQGKMTLGIVVSRDVTELRQLEQVREECISLISHDLRTPLTVIIGYAGLLRRAIAASDQERLSKSVEAIYTNGKRMDTMIQELVESVRLEAGTLELQREPVSLPHLVQEVVEQSIEPDSAARVRVQVPDLDFPIVNGDRARLQRMLVNLLTNALKYSAPDQPVELVLSSSDHEVEVSVIDRGIGIEPDDLPHLFERFYRTGNAFQKAIGLGLGLYITRLLAEAHGGRIWAESEAGRGSTFSFTLPLP